MTWLFLARWQLGQPQALWGLLLLPLLWVLRERSTAGLVPWRSFGATLLRTLALAALVVALARPYQEVDVADRSAVVVLDASASLDPDRRDVAARWLEGAERARQEAPVRVVLASARSQVFDDPAAALDGLGDEVAAPPEAGTDLRAALDLGLASLPPARHREIVLLSDGAATRGTLEEAVRVAQARDVRVHAVPLGPSSLRVSIASVVPQQDRLLGDDVTVGVALRASARVAGSLEMSADGRGPPVATRQVEFGPGPGEASLSFTPSTAGLHEVEVVLSVPGDPATADDVRRARLRVQPRPRALVVGAPDQARALRKAVAGYRPELAVEQVTTLPDPPYEGYPLVVLLDPDLRSLGEERSAALASAVAAGGKLVVTGGGNGLVADEPGAEPLAEVLPVIFPKTKKKERTPLAVVYCLDSSDSMAGSAKFELASAALAQSLYLLPAESRAGVIAFSDFPTWVVPLGPFAGSDAVVESLSQVRVRGGTSIYAALQAAYEALRDDDALARHVVLLSDGQSTTTFARNGDVVTSLLRRKITVSTIAISKDSDRPEMERIAEAGGGRAWYADRWNDLPRLFLDEMMIVTRTNKVEQEFLVRPVLGSRWLSRVPKDASWPPLSGYVRGEQRPGSELALATPDGHPVLVAGRHGRGTIAMFTSDVGGDWSSKWATWEHHAALWESVLQALLRPEPPERMSLATRVEGRRGEIVFDVLDPLMNPRGDLRVEAIVEPPDGPGVAIDLPPVGPGRYGARLDLSGAGATLVRVAATGTTGKEGPQAPGGELLASLEPGAPEELRAASFDPLLLRAVADQTQGMWDPSPAQVFGAEVPRKTVFRPRHAGLLWAAMVLLLLDLAWRRARLPARGPRGQMVG